jgi:hypothetical protein
MPFWTTSAVWVKYEFMQLSKKDISPLIGSSNANEVSVCVLEDYTMNNI